MYDEIMTNVRISNRLTDEFPSTIGVYQGSTLSFFLFVIVINEITRNIREDSRYLFLDQGLWFGLILVIFTQHYHFNNLSIAAKSRKTSLAMSPTVHTTFNTKSHCMLLSPLICLP